MKKSIIILLGFLVLVMGGAILISRFLPMDERILDDTAGNEISSQTDETESELSTLPIPPLLEQTDTSGETSLYELAVQAGMTEFIEGVETETMGYNGSYLGPTIRLRNGQDVSIAVENQLISELTTVHWHGLKVDGEADGGPHSPIQPGETWTPEFTVDQPAASLWYHPHLENNTGRQVYQGLAGLMIIDDAVSDQLNLPDRYGENDIPLIIQDRRFESEGRFEYELDMQDIMFGIQGETILVNEKIDPVLMVERGLMRFRVLNGSNASVFDLELSDGQAVYQIGTDGGLMELPVETGNVELGPAERVELLIDFSDYEAGDQVSLEHANRPIMDFVVSTEENDLEIPDSLVEIEWIDPASAVRTREFVFSGMGLNVQINGKQFDSDRIDEVVSYGDTEIWEVSNQAGMGMGMGMMDGGIHPFHAHGVQFQILDRNGEPPLETEAGWKDVFIVNPNETVRVITRFTKKGLFMYHCHILEHEDAGMMGQFEVR